MADLIVIGYSDPATAEKARDALFSLPRTDLSRLSEVVVAFRCADGAIKLSHSVHSWILKSASGLIGGALIGLIFLHPIFGLMAGAAAGAVSGALSDYGVDEFFIKAIDESLQSGGAAVFLCRDLSTDSAFNERVIEKLASYGGRVLETNLNAERKHQMQQAFEDARRAALEQATSIAEDE